MLNHIKLLAQEEGIPTLENSGTIWETHLFLRSDEVEKQVLIERLKTSPITTPGLSS